MACKCDSGLGNTGLPNCAPIAGVTKKLIFVQTYDSTGAKNYIDLTATLDAAYLTTQLNAASDVRWYPTPSMENVTSERAESTFDEAPSGRKQFIREGVRSMSGELWGKEALPQIIGKFKANRCVDMSAYIVTDNGIVGSADVEDLDKVYPIQLDPQSLDSTLMFTTDTTGQKVMLSVDWDDNEKDENLYMIEAENDFTFDALNSNGLLDIYASYSSISTTGFEAKLYTIYGSFNSLAVDAGLAIGDFALYNVTTSSAITITSVTENPDGTYTFVIPAQTSADVLRLTPTKNGRDYTKVVANTITIP